MAASKDPTRRRAPQLRLTWDRALAWRLRRHHLTAPAGGPVELVGALAGVQAQVPSMTAHAVGIRTPTDSDTVEQLLWGDRLLVKTWAMRGTLHLLPARDFATWVGALRTREWRITPAWEQYHGVTRAELDAITAAIPQALSAEPLTRERLAERISDATGHRHLDAALRSGWAAVLKPAANRGLLCQGPPADGSTTFVEPAGWLGSLSPEPDTETALRRVLGWFLDAHGPATHDDFARWFGSTPAAARKVLTRHADDLALVDVDGLRAWMTPQGAEEAAGAVPASSVHLLPGFDPYVLAPISHRDHTIPPGRVADVSRTAGWIAPVVVVDGRIAGTWTHARDGDATIVTITAFAPLPRRVLDGAREHLERSHASVLKGPLTIVVDG